MRGYKELIVASTHCSAVNVDAIEGIMRHQNGGVLDSLTLEKFTADAREAHQAVIAMRQDDECADVLAYFQAQGR